jgi:lysophospholipase L1-like esterase
MAGWRRGWRVLGPVSIALMLVAVAGIGGVDAYDSDEASAASGPVYQAPSAYYLALGDSITYGFQPNKPKAAPASAFDSGYVDLFAARLHKLSPKIQVVNYGCPGESTRTFTVGGCPGRGDVKALHNAFKGVQLDAALAFLRAHPGQVGPITLSLFGNDWFPVVFEQCKGKLTCIRKHAPSEVTSFGSRLTSILRRLRAAAPKTEIIVTGAWNIDPDSLEQLRPVYLSFNLAIARAAATSRSRFADTLPVFNPIGSPRALKARLCALSFICSKGDPHPTDAGYRAIADTTMAASGYPQRP